MPIHLLSHQHFTKKKKEIVSTNKHEEKLINRFAVLLRIGSISVM